MDESAEEVRKLLRQQAALARFGGFALRGQSDLLMILTEAARVCAEGLSVPFAKVWRYRVAENDFIVEAGYGWEAGVVGHVVSSADANSPHGRAFITGQPSICVDLRQNNELPAFYAQHGIISTIDVVIKGGEQPGDRPYGVLEIGSDFQRDYDQHDIDFLTGFANILAEAVGTSARTNILQATVKQMMGLVEEKNRLLDQKNILAEEMQHRVRNNLQVVYGMLSRQADETADTKGKRGINAIARRVSTLAQVYDHLLGREMTRTIDFGGYAKSLCTSLAKIRPASARAVTLTCDSESLVLDLDVVTALGLVVAELVANSFDHAFPDGKGSIVVSVHRPPHSAGQATLTVSDNGSGFTPQAESKRHGLGLVRRLMEQVNGTATVESEHGTAWTMRFPATIAAGVTPDAARGVADRLNAPPISAG